MEVEISPGRNYVYCATFKLAWDMMNGGSSGSSQSPMAPALHRLDFSEKDLDPSSYLTATGSTEEITKKMKDRFPESGLELPVGDEWQDSAAFAYLQKSLPFREKFDRLDAPLIFQKDSKPVPVAGFGIEAFGKISKRDTVHRAQISIIDYRNKDDFAVELNTLSK